MSNQSANNKRIAKNTFFLYVRMILVLLVSLYTTRVVLDALGVIDYGISNVVGGFVSMFSFLNTSMSNAIQRFYNFQLGKNGDKSLIDVYNTAIQLQVLIAFLLFVLLETIGVWYMYTQMVIPMERFSTAMWIFQFSVMSMLLTVIQIPYSAAIMAYERMDYFAYVSIFEVSAKLVTAYVLMSSNGDRLLLYGTLNVVVSILSFLFYVIYCKFHFEHLNLKFEFHKDLFKPMLSFSGWNLFGSFAYMIKGQGLNMLLNIFFGPIVNAARGISAMILNAIQGFQGNIVVAFRPQIVRSYSVGEFSRVKDFFYSLSKISYVLLAILSLPILIEIYSIFNLWLGDNIPNYTKTFTILVLLNMIVSSLTTPVSQVVHASGKMKQFQIATSIVVCSILPLSWFFLKLGFSPISTYVVSLVMTVINQVVCCWYMKKIFPYSLREYIRNVIVPCMFFSVLSPIIPYLITYYFEPSILRLMVVTFISVLISSVIAYFFVFNQSERKVVDSFLIKKILKNRYKKQS